jgi:CRP-like cAMP-binding protein
MVKLALALTAAVFAPSELCPNGYMYISHRGIVLYGGRVLTSGKVWGEDMILSSPALRSKYAARCMTYVEVYVISRDELLDLAKQFPATLRIVRRSSFRLAFRREMIRRAQENADALSGAKEQRNMMLAEVRRRVAHGAFVLSVPGVAGGPYAGALAARERVREDFARVFRRAPADAEAAGGPDAGD